MPRDGNRTQRVASTVRHQLASYICEHYPHFGNMLFSVTYLKVSPDLSVVDIYCSCLEGEAIQPMLEQLTHDAKYIRQQLAHKSPMKKFPALRFRADETHASSRRIDDILRNL